MKTWLLMAIVWLFLGVGCGSDSDGCVSADSDDDTTPVDDDNDDDSTSDDDDDDDDVPPDDDDDNNDDNNDNDNNDNDNNDTSPDDDDDTISDQWDHELVDAEGNAEVQMVIDAFDRVHLTYLFRDNTCEKKYARKDGGTWSKETIVADSVTWGTGVGLAVDSSGAAQMAYHLEGADELWYATNESGNLERMLLEKDVGSTAPEIVLDNDDNVYIKYTDPAGKYTPVLLWSRIGDEWEKTVLIEDATLYCIAVDVGGHFFAEYATYGTSKTLAYAENTTGDWVVHDIETVAPGERLAGAEMVLSPSGALFFAFGVDEIRAKRYGSYYTDSYHAGWQEEQIPYLQTGPRLAVDGDEKAHVTACGRYATNKSGIWTAELVTLYAAYSAIATDSENRPYIAYATHDDHKLYLATRKE